MQSGMITTTKKSTPPQSKKHTAEEQPVLKLYRNIDELPFNVFLDCQCDKVLTGLIISGHATAEQLALAWEQLGKEFVSRFDEKSSRGKMTKVVDAAIYENKIRSVEAIIEVAEVLPTEDVFNLLYTFNYPLPVIKYSEEGMAKLLRILIGYYRLDRTSYSLIETELAEEKTEPEKSADRKQFIELMTEIAIGFKSPVMMPNQITAGQFCSMVNQYRQYLQQLNESSQKQ
ncbi:MAG: hypothetical protein ACOYLG_13090 [Chitinophagaceae bacterium]